MPPLGGIRWARERVVLVKLVQMELSLFRIVLIKLARRRGVDPCYYTTNPVGTLLECTKPECYY